MTNLDRLRDSTGLLLSKLLLVLCIILVVLFRRLLFVVC